MLSIASNQRIRLGSINFALKSTSLNFYAKSTSNGIYQGGSHRKDGESKSKAFKQRRDSNTDISLMRYQARSSSWSEPKNKNNQINGLCGNSMDKYRRKEQSHNNAYHNSLKKNHNSAKYNRALFSTTRNNSGTSTRSKERSSAKKERPHVTDENDGEDEDENELVQLSVPDWSTIKSNKTNIGYYEPSKYTLDRCKSTIDEYCQQNKIIVRGEIPEPVLNVDELTCAFQLVGNLAKLGKIDQFSPLQSYAIPCILSGKNLVGTGLMGSGKKLAALLPALIHITKQTPSSDNSSPMAVIIVPEVEIAKQLQEMANSLSDMIHSKILSTNPRKLKPFEKCDIIFADPASLYLSLLTKTINLHQCSYFAYYEFDRMLNMNFMREIEQIHSQLQPKCQKILLTARWNGDISNYALGITNDFVHLQVKSNESQLDVNTNGSHIVRVSDEKNKHKTLFEFVNAIKKSNKRKTLIFTRTIQRANDVANLLRRNGASSVDVLHNDKTKEQREKTVDEFNKGHIEFLVLTDVAARYRQFQTVDNVLSYDMSFSIADFQQRLSRNILKDRDHNGVKAFTIITEENGALINEFITLLQQANQIIQPSLFIMRAMFSEEKISYALPDIDSDGINVYTINKDE